MRKKINLTVIAAFAVPLQVAAEEQQLPTIIVEGSYERPGTFTTAPDSSGLKDIATLLERVPGANVNRNGPLTGIAAYHGMYGNRINVTVDGAAIKEVGPNSMDPPLSHYPAPLTKSLKVQQGIAPVSSGIETIGGSMKAESRKGRFAKGDGIETSGIASMGYSSVQDGRYGVLMGSVANKNHKIFLSGSEEKGRDYKIKNNQKQVPTSYDRNAFSAGYGYQRDGHELDLNYSNADTGHAGTPALPMDIMYIRGGLYNGAYRWDFGDGYQLKVDGFYQKMRHLMDNFTMRSLGGDSKQNRTNVEAEGLNLAFSLPLLDGNMAIGVNGDQANHEADITNVTKSKKINFFNGVERNRYSFFAEWGGDLVRNLSLELGGRYTHAWSDTDNAGSEVPGQQADLIAFNSVNHGRNFDFVDFDAIFRYAISSQLDIELGFGRKNRAPSYQALYLWTNASSVGGLADGNTYLGDLNLKNETAYQFNMSVDWHTDKAYVSPRVFYHYISNYIQGLRTTKAVAKGKNILQFSNIEAQLFGVDLEAGYSINDNWRLDAGLNYVRGQSLDSRAPDDDLYRMAPLNGRTQLTYEQSGWMGVMEGIFVADQGDVAGYNNELKTKGYMLLNFRGKYEPYKGVVIGTGIENVLDTKHFNHLGGYQLHNRSNGRVAMPGRNVYATLSYSW